MTQVTKALAWGPTESAQRAVAKKKKDEMREKEVVHVVFDRNFWNSEAGAAVTDACRQCYHLQGKTSPC